MVVGLVLMVILLLLAQFAIEMDTSERMEEVARFFVTCVAFCVPISALYANGRAYCEAMGVTSTTLYFGLLAVVLNVPLCYVLIFGHFGLPALGGKGCGVATLCSLSLSTVIMYLYISLHPKLKDYSVLKNRSGINFQGIKDFTKLALPLGISSSVECSCFALIALLLSPLGPTVVSAHTITMSLTSFTFNIPLSLGIASSIMVGYAIGKNNLNTLRLNIKAGYWVMLISISISIAILVGGRNHLPRLFSHDEAVLALAGILIFFASFNQLFESVQTIQAFMLRGFKDTLTILAVTFVAFYCVALPVGVTLCYGYLKIPFLETLIGDPQTGLEGPRGFWVGLSCGLITASILYRLRVLKHYRNIKTAMQHPEQAQQQQPEQAPATQRAES